MINSYTSMNTVIQHRAKYKKLYLKIAIMNQKIIIQYLLCAFTLNITRNKVYLFSEAIWRVVHPISFTLPSKEADNPNGGFGGFETKNM